MARKQKLTPLLLKFISMLSPRALSHPFALSIDSPDLSLLSYIFHELWTVRATLRSQRWRLQGRPMEEDCRLCSSMFCFCWGTYLAREQ